MSKKTLLLLSIVLSLILAPLAVVQDQIRNALAASQADRPQFGDAGQAPAGLQADEWTHIVEKVQAQYPEIAILHASDAQYADVFGEMVAINGDTLVVGARGEDGGSGDPIPDAGAVYVFERNLGGPGNWGEAAVLHAGDAQEDDWFGSSVAISGDTLVVGAFGEDGGPGDPLPDSGAIYVFERNLGGLGNWGEATVLHASDAQADDLLGSEIAISGDTLVVGVQIESGGPGDPLPNSGAVYVFERNLGGAGVWAEAAILHASDAQAYDSFGVSVAISGDTLVVGAFGEDGGPGDPRPNTGAVYVFERNLQDPGSWSEATILHTNAPSWIESSFGYSVAISGDTLVGSTISYLWSVVLVFERNLGGADNWGEAASLQASDYQDYDTFGLSVSLSGDTLAVGADTNYPFGAAYVFERDFGGPGNWGEAAILHSSDADPYDFFGHSVAISGDTVVVGASGEDGGGGNPLLSSGAAYIFQTFTIYLPVLTRP